MASARPTCSWRWKAVAPLTALLVAALGLPSALGQQAWSPTTERFASGAGGWSGSSVGISKCTDAAWDTVLGGFGILGRGGLVQKRFTDLPEHKGLVLNLDYLFVNSWQPAEVALVYADGKLVWEGQRSLRSDVTTCTSRTQVRRLSVLLPDHTSSSVLVRISSTLRAPPNQRSFAVDNVAIVPVATNEPSFSAGAPSEPAGTSYSASFLEDAFDGWSGYGLQGLSCAQDTETFGLATTGMKGGALEVSKILTGLPAHRAIRVTFTYHFLHGRNDTVPMAGSLMLDGVQVWFEEQYQ